VATSRRVRWLLLVRKKQTPASDYDKPNRITDLTDDLVALLLG
jgi:hypothetical protein